MDGSDALVRIVWGTAPGPTALSAYDASLSAAGVGDYNLLTVSSIIPAEAAVEMVGTASDLGPAGDRLTVVQAEATVEGPGRATAGIGWTGGESPGVVYEAAGAFDEDTAERRIEGGLSAARDLRDWPFTEGDIKTATTTADAGEFGAAVALAVYGEGEPLF